MIEINFGMSDYARWYPGVPPTENIIRITESKELLTIPDHYLLGKTQKKIEKCNLRGFDSIDILVDEEHLGYERLYLLWINQRKEWIAIYYRTWCEAACVWDEDYSGPFALNEFCSKGILGAYKIPESLISLENVRNISPSELEKIGSNQIKV
jgi:hypothetical protein